MILIKANFIMSKRKKKRVLGKLVAVPNYHGSLPSRSYGTSKSELKILYNFSLCVQNIGSQVNNIKTRSFT